MNEPIKVGDLVIVVCWQHDHRNLALGRIYTVEDIRGGAVICEDCGERFPGPTATLSRPGKTGFAPVAWLKRIPPIEELEREKRREDIREPA